ncbi:hypothetical protein [Prosthecobacter sp.]|uniref:hypothetical protein n=1 Tax=Prosthecobacter sp. TaxID=1965333 RepID=UPI0025CBE9C8|nr:hypothetical protein [Prosthecobacter sp.]
MTLSLLESLLVLMHLHQAACLLLCRVMQGLWHAHLLELLQLLVHLKLLLLLLVVELLLHGQLLHLLNLEVELIQFLHLQLDKLLLALLDHVHHHLLHLRQWHLLLELLHDLDLLLPHLEHLRLELLVWWQLVELVALLHHLLDLHPEPFARIELLTRLLLVLTIHVRRACCVDLRALCGVVLLRRGLLRRGLRLLVVADDCGTFDLGWRRWPFGLLPARGRLWRRVSMPPDHILRLRLWLGGF